MADVQRVDRDDAGAVKDVVVIGGGNMGAALLGGLVDSGVMSPECLGVVELIESRREVLHDLFPGVTVTHAVPACASAVLAVKPGDIPAAAASAAAAGATRLLSIAAGVRIATIEEAAGDSVAVIRAMPNTPALVRLGACAIAAGTAATAADVDWAATVLEAVGTVERLTEDDLDAFTGVAGSGPAYVFLVAEALTDAAVEQGLDREVAERTVRQLLLGSATLLDREGDPGRLREMVTSPGGTTAAGLARLADRGVRDAFADAVRAATARSRELG
jgi:pyrroline-5-carboxylate reductase